MTADSTITINGITIGTEQIYAEMQYHAANNRFDAIHAARQALVVRELLIQRAVDLKLSKRQDALKKPDAIVDELLEREISIPTADLETCQRFYQTHKHRFMTSPLFEVSHILYSAPPSDTQSRDMAYDRAKKATFQIIADPQCFAAIAKAESACSSAQQGGFLGQITKGQTTPAFELALFGMQDGDISREPVASEFGYHLIKIHKRLDGKKLPFDVVHDWIIDYLERQSWQRAFHQYIMWLAGQAKITGINIVKASSPLVQ